MNSAKGHFRSIIASRTLCHCTKSVGLSTLYVAALDGPRYRNDHLMDAEHQSLKGRMSGQVAPVGIRRRKCPARHEHYPFLWQVVVSMETIPVFSGGVDMVAKDAQRAQHLGKRLDEGGGACATMPIPVNQRTAAMT